MSMPDDPPDTTIKLTKRIRFGTRLIQHVSLLSAGLLVLTVAAYVFVALQVNAYTQETTQLVKIRDTIQVAESSLIDQETGQRGYDLTGNRSFLDPFYAGTTTFAQASATLQRAVLAHLVLRAHFAELIRDGTIWHNNFGLPQVMLKAHGHTITTEQLTAGKNAFDTFRQACQLAIQNVDTAQLSVQGRMHRFIAVTFALAIMVAFAIVLFVVYLILRLIRKTIAPLNILMSAVSEYATENFDTVLNVDGRRDEIGQLTQDVEVMRQELKRSFRLNEALVQIGTELQNAMTQREVYENALRNIASIWTCDATLLTAAENGQYWSILEYQNGQIANTNEMIHSADMLTLTSVLTEGRTLFFPNWNVDRPNGAREEIRYQRGYRSSIHMAIMYQGTCLALCSIESKQAGYFTAEDVDLCDKIGSLLGLAIKNAKIFDESQRHASIDDLTGVSNRRCFNQILPSEVAHAEIYKTPFSLILLDIDHFKHFNDRYGHLEGDSILQHVATLLNKNARPNDIVARYGGEEFAIILSETTSAQSSHFAERLRAEIETNKLNDYHVTCSFGVATYRPGDDEQTLIRRADQALYKAKELGRNRVEVSASMA